MQRLVVAAENRGNAESRLGNPFGEKTADRQIIKGRPTVFLRLHRNVLDQSLASGFFIYEHDRQLFSMLFHWSLTVNDFNRCLDITEYHTFSSQSNSEAVKIWYENFVSGETINATRIACKDLYEYLVNEYGQEAKIDSDAKFFEMVKTVSDTDRPQQ